MRETSPSPAAAHLASGARLALIGIGINVVLAAVKLLTGFLGHSYALIADGVESTLDIAASLVIWSGLKFAARPPDETHPYGHGKAEPVSAIIVSLAVMAAAVGLAVASAREILTPHHAPAPYTLIILVAIVCIKELMYRLVMRAGNRTGSTALKADAIHHRSDALTSVAAFVGISIALIGGDGYEPADDYAALLACGWIAYNGFRLFLPALNDVLDAAPPPEVEDNVRAAAKAVEGVREIDQCRVRKMGLEYYVDLHIEVDGHIPVSEGHEIAHEVKDALLRSDLSVADVLVHVEPVERDHRHRPI